MLKQKGAMFGLDARIALAIFSALSVITGAALYNSVREAKTVKVVTEIEELRKALDQYILDTATYLPVLSSASNVVHLGYLFKNYGSDKNWKGPYFGKGSNTEETMYISLINNYSVDRLYKAYRQSYNASWGGPTFADVTPGNCSSSDCGIYLSRSYVDNDSETSLLIKKLYADLENYIDHNDGPGVGKVRARNGGATLYVYLGPEWRKLKS